MTKESISDKISRRIRKLQNMVWFYTPKAVANKKKLEKLKDIYAGKRCFVMGNGPSLLKCDLTLLRNEICIASNAQYLIWDLMTFVPTFLTVEDRLVAEDRKGELNAIKATTKVFPKDLSPFLKLDEKTLYANFLRYYNDFPRFSDDFASQVYWGGTVSYMNLQLAYFLGCTEIYMIGFDHSYKVSGKMDNTVITSETDDVNHIHPNYFGKGYRWHDPNVDRMQQGYVEARRFLDAKGVKVFNATVGGKLEVFERIDYNTLF